MSPNFKAFVGIIGCLALAVLLTSCSQSLEILDGATHACGNVHIEGYFTDTQGEVIVVKAPDTWDANQVKEFCSGSD